MNESLCILWCVMGVWLQIFLLWWRPLGATAAGGLPEQSHRRPTGVWVPAHARAPHHRKYIYPCTNFLNPNKLFWGSVFSIQYWTFPQWVLYPFKNRTEMCPIFLTIASQVSDFSLNTSWDYQTRFPIQFGAWSPCSYPE